MVYGLFFYATLTDCKGSHTLFVQARGKHPTPGRRRLSPTQDVLVRSFQEGGAGVGDESTESRSVVQQLRISSVIRPEHRTFDVIR